jgi:RND superfamily putative drug exporter
MVLMGKINWWIPGWLDRILPHMSIEGAEFFLARDAPPVVEAEPVAGA